MIEAEGALLDDLPERLERFHYDLVATTTFHADEAQVLAAGRVPVVAMLVGPAYVELVHEIAGLPEGSRVGLVCASERGADNIRETLALSGTTGVEIVSALIGRARGPRAGRPDRRPHPDVARGARRRARPAFSQAGADPAVDLRVRPVRPRAAAPGDRARRPPAGPSEAVAGLTPRGAPRSRHGAACDASADARLPRPARARASGTASTRAARGPRRPRRRATWPASAGWPPG